MRPFCTLHPHLLLILRFYRKPSQTCLFTSPSLRFPCLLAASLPSSCTSLHQSLVIISLSSTDSSASTTHLSAYSAYRGGSWWAAAEACRRVGTCASGEGRQEGSSVRHAFQPAVASCLLSGDNRGPALGSSLRDKLDHLPVFNLADPACCQRASPQQVQQQRFGTSASTRRLTTPEL